jgi:hypothetical protein
MNSYVAVIRLRRGGVRSALAPRVDGLLCGMRGVLGVEVDASCPAVSVVFDRAAVSLGDLVRALEDGDVGVSGVAQSRADAQTQIDAAIA